MAEPIGQVVERLQSLPLQVHAVVGLAMIAGLMMWAWGWKVLKPMTVVVSALAGAYAASLAAPSLGIMRDVKIEAIVLAGFAFGALGGLLVYRSAMALGCGVVVGVAAPLVASVVLESQSPRERELSQEEQYLRGVEVQGGGAARSGSPERDRVADEIRDLMRHAAGDPPRSAEGAAQGAAEDGESEEGAAARLRRFVEAVGQEAEAQWNRLPERHRFVYGTTAIAGLAIGVLLGLVLPKRAAGAVTALFGAAVWLPCFVWLSGAWDMPWRGALGGLDGRAWLVVWAAAALVGLALQWQGMKRERRRKSSGDGPGAEG